MRKVADMTEQIGKVILDLSKYAGEDLYCDGAVEDELLDIVQKHAPEDYQRLIEQRGSWPILYHLSALRENIVDFVPMTEQDRVLEVGSGCGAITGALARKAGSVTCVELSKKRSLINAHRHSECGNVTIHVGNFQDIETQLPQDYDYICLIGVFEYGRAYIGGDHPYEEFLRILMRHLAPGGHILIAIENKYGLKYFAGCTEDHLGTYFSGIENYRGEGSARTFSRQGLEKIFSACDIRECSFYYPYPDYKFMTSVYSDSHQPRRGELSNNLRNYDRDRMVLFDEESAFDGIVEDGLFSVFANSYLAVIGPPFATQYVKYSNDRAKEFRIRTEFCQNEEGLRVVRKYPLTQEAREHVRRMAWACERLSERYQGSGLAINRCRLTDNDNECYAEFEYLSGRPLSELLDECLERGDQEGFWQYFDRYIQLTGYHEDFPVTDFDLIFSNIIVHGSEWTLIDYEWTFDGAVASRELAYRAVYCYLLESGKRHSLDMSMFLEKLGLSETRAQELRDRERQFQQYVEGKTVSMAVLREIINRKLIEPQRWLEKLETNAAISRVQIYEDTGAGYTEENSYFLKQAYVDDTRIEVELSVGGNVRMLRVDPAMDCGICNILELCFNGETVPLNASKVLVVNGSLLKCRAMDGSMHQTAVFSTKDPNININIARLKPRAENTLFMRLEMVRMPMQMVEDVERALRRLI
ncbi:MAG: class I SAM-dependent methyltransferase [bacterium]|nr:class I SAM-dependent methyltransferase [bacterium]MCM1374932.1 class I SAM-dependent methyltransferase [Muribaculum sp.]